MSVLRKLFSAVKYWHNRFFNIYPVGQGLKSSSGCFHTRQIACKQSVADVQQARHFFSPCPTKQNFENSEQLLLMCTKKDKG